MAVKKIEEPNVYEANIDDWKKILYRTTAQGGGFICVEITNINANGKPEIAAGSRFEINHVFFETTTNETITVSPSNNGQWYIYAIPTGDTCTFLFRNIQPTWSAAKGGWYDGNNRAIVKFFYLTVGTQYNNKVILDSYNAMEHINITQPALMTGGVVVNIPGYVANNPFDATINLEAGLYRYELKGGNGGAGGTKGVGGDGGNAGYVPNTDGYGIVGIQGDPGLDGNSGGASNSISGVFYHYGGGIRIRVGANGGGGGSGGKGGKGANGGSSYDNINGGKGGKGGSGGGGGKGQDSFIGEIVAFGGNAGAATGLADSTEGKRGYEDGIGGNGGVGYSGGSTGLYNIILGSPGSPGTVGLGLSTSTSGYARLWRIG
jgi:hypothetical protein